MIDNAHDRSIHGRVLAAGRHPRRTALHDEHFFAKAGVHTPRPSDSLFVVESVYSWRLLDELASLAAQSPR